MESRVRVKILPEMHFWSKKDMEREPVGWFHFEEAFKFNTLPEIFVRFIQLHLKKTICCKESISQIIIIFENEEDEYRDIDPEISGSRIQCLLGSQ